MDNSYNTCEEILTFSPKTEDLTNDWRTAGIRSIILHDILYYT
jgi:hypothetical protein